jgi:hypothetical protein
MAVEAPATVIAGLRPEHWPAVARIYAEVAVSDRCVYAGVVEHSVYVAEHAHGPSSGR